MSVLTSIRELTFQNIKSVTQGLRTYYAQPALRDSWGGAFNGQVVRRKIFHEIVSQFAPEFICETGTYRGTTAAYISSKYDLAFYTIEAIPHNFGFALGALWRKPNASQLMGDSRTGLIRIAAISSLNAKFGVFYLDAHWHDDLPLREEIEIICSKWSEALILIDDFCVDDDAGYTFDDYGPGKVLNLDYIRDAVKKFELQAYWPRSRSDEETGARRGCVAIAHGARIQAMARKAATLRLVGVKQLT